MPGVSKPSVDGGALLAEGARDPLVVKKMKKVKSKDSLSGDAKKDKKDKKRKKASSSSDDSADDKPAKVKKAKKAKKAPEPSDSVDTAEASMDSAEGDAASPPARLSDADYRAAHEITIKGAAAPAPFQTFEEAPFAPKVKAAIQGAGFSAPSAIQAQAWPAALRGQDCLAVAKTGSGKTCGYLMPAMHKIIEAGNGSSAKGGARILPKAVVMAPTRELAMQIADEAGKFGRAAGVRTAAIYGGAPKGPQIRDLQSGVEVIIATPGRLLDMLNFKCFNGSAPTSLAEVDTLVLDEADRMLDMGFEKDIMKIIEAIPTGHQTLFFTATWPKAVQRVAGQILKNPVQINIGNTDQLVANKDVAQTVVRCRHNEKMDKLVEIVKGADSEIRMIIFANKKRDVQSVADGLWHGGCFVDSIHGDKLQNEREKILNQFKAGEVKILVATDVAARGLDIKGVDQVVCYDFPVNVEDYVHRIGRTGRAGIKGKALTFFTDHDSHHSRDLVKIMKDAGQEVPKDLEQMALACRPSGGKKGGGWRGGGRGGGRGRGGGGRGGGGRGGGRRW